MEELHLPIRIDARLAIYEGAIRRLELFGARHDGLPNRTGLQNFARGGRQVNGFEVAALQSISHDFKLLMGRLVAIDNDQVAVAQPANSAPRAISYLAHDAFAADLEPDPLRRFDQFIEHALGP